MSNISNDFKDSVQLVVVKAAVDAIAEPVKALLIKQLAAVGIEAEVQININTLSVNLDTLKNANKRRTN